MQGCTFVMLTTNHIENDIRRVKDNDDADGDSDNKGDNDDVEDNDDV